ncbi:hypothetical protein BD324DRAFT_613043 [Kockovaella imperatae]|uniref:Uncharacterized protein n=1 Tax=Kockovaella imperatae TaxID=4999 RepID=A0A1Y1UU32_9TREE|nr:hypothetical protein BD324DRAFT_613043 [Kockovaella imperatae]ORX41054.1 hypothetical protein BD324DRAFT_613043 [Kockovaella imperatae]
MTNSTNEDTGLAAEAVSQYEEANFSLDLFSTGAGATYFENCHGRTPGQWASERGIEYTPGQFVESLIEQVMATEGDEKTRLLRELHETWIDDLRGSVDVLPDHMWLFDRLDWMTNEELTRSKSDIVASVANEASLDNAPEHLQRSLTEELFAEDAPPSVKRKVWSDAVRLWIDAAVTQSENLHDDSDEEASSVSSKHSQKSGAALPPDMDGVSDRLGALQI